MESRSRKSMRLSKKGILMINKMLGGALLVAGTTIGAGVLAVPVSTSEGGFLPTTLLYIVSWFIAVASGYCFLEVLTWTHSRKNVNMVSMAEYTLGHKSKIIMWLVYLLLFYSLLVAYFCDGGNILMRVMGCRSWDTPWIRHAMPVVFFALFSPLLMAKTSIIDQCNRVFVFGLGIAFAMFCYFGFPLMKTDLLVRSAWGATLKGFPILFLAFGFQNVVPTLYHYMDKNVKDVKKAIVIGSSIPLVLYIIWEAIVLGAVPISFLEQAKVEGWTAIGALQTALKCSAFYVAGEFFGFFALISSFIGVSLGLKDFFIDAFQWDEKKRKVEIFFLVFVFPLVWAVFYPGIVLKCLECTGALGETIVLGVFPVLMVWKGRYGKKRYYGKRILPGGKGTLLVMSGLALLNLVLIAQKFLGY